MNIDYDGETDTLTIRLRESPVAESEEAAPGVIFDYDASGSLLSIEVLSASRRGAPAVPDSR